MNSETRIAVLVGNCKYPHFNEAELPTLTTPDNDVRGLQKTLQKPERGDFKTVECLSDADSQEIRDRVEELIRQSANPGTLGVIFYSGHGLLDADNRLHLAAHDSRPGTWNRTIPISDIANWIRLHNPQKLVLLLDCCYSGAGLKDMEYKGLSGPQALPALKKAMSQNLDQLHQKGVVMITATSPIQQAKGDRTKGFGVFTKYVIDGLDTGFARKGRKKLVTVRDLYSYVSKKMEDEADCEQTPMIWGAESGGELVISGTNLMGEKSKPVCPKLEYNLLKQERKPILDLVGPTYILDRNYHFRDWNTSFEYFVAKPLGLRRGSHVATFLEKLHNFDEVEKRSNSRFRPNFVPGVDIEVLEYESKDYGLIVFDKIATQIMGPTGKLRAWCVNLNVSSVQRKGKFWLKMEDNLRRDLNWSRYATHYDRVISSFSEHKKLVKLVTSKIGTPGRCLDLGSGTGSVTFALLAAAPDAEIVAIEKNEAMLDCMLRKIELAQDPTVKQRVHLYKGDIITRLQQEVENSFDACVMLNVLFSLDCPTEALAEIHRVLRPGGILSLSTSHKGTDINKLFAEIKKALTKDDQWDEQTEWAWSEAFERNNEMKDLITRDTKDEVKQLVTNAGFSIEEYEPSQYVDCVVVIKAVKNRKPN